MRILVWVLLLFSYSTLAQERQGFFKNYNSNQGLPSDRILSVCQDSHGFLWFGSNDGLSRFDGYRFKNYFNDPQKESFIASSNIFYMASDDDGFLWLGHYESGIDRFDPQKGIVLEHFDENSGLKDNRITYVRSDGSQEKIWIGTHQNMFCFYNLEKHKLEFPKFIKANKNVKDLPEKNSLYHVEPHATLANYYWLSTNDGLILYNIITGHYEYFRYPENNRAGFENRMRGSVMINDSTLWIGSRGGGVLEFDVKNKSFKNYVYSKNNLGNLIVQVLKKTDSEIWISTWDNGLGVFNTITKTFSFYNNEPSIPSSILPETVNRVFYDSQNTLWCVTATGVSQFSENFQRFPVINIPHKEESISNTIFEPISICDDKENVYLGMRSSEGLVVYNKTSGETKLIRPPAINSDKTFTVRRVAVSPDGIVYWVTYEGIYLYNPNTRKASILKIPPEMASSKYNSIAFNEKTLIIGTRDDGVFFWNKESGEVKNITNKDGLSHQKLVYELHIDRKKHLWITTERGLSVYDLKTEKVIKTLTQTDGFKVIYRLTEDIYGNIWFSTEHQGVFGIEPSSLEIFRNLTTSDGLASNAIQHLAADKEGNLWVATQRGLNKYNLKTEAITTYNRTNGLIDDHLQGSLNSLSDGRIAQGFKSAFTIFSPTEFGGSKKNFKPKLVDFYVFDIAQTLLDTSIVLSYQQNYFSFDFSSFDFVNADNFKYEYKLEGNDDYWTKTKRTNVSYTNLEPGAYNLLLKEEGSRLYSSYTINILPPFWKKTWFRFSALLLILGAIYGAYVIKINQIKREEKIKAKMNKQLAGLEMKALRSQMNPHFLFNSLNSIKYYILKNQSDLASKYLNKFSMLIRLVLNNSEQDFISMADEIETLKLYLEMEVLRFSGKLDYNIKVAKDIELDFIYIPTMILQPYVENAIWHGLMQKAKGGSVLIDIRNLNDEQVLICIMDDGVGRKKAMELRSKSVTKRKSLGMKITDERINLININYQIDMNVEVIDLFDSLNMASGTQVNVRYNVQKKI